MPQSQTRHELVMFQVKATTTTTTKGKRSKNFV